MSIKHIAQMYCVNGKYFAEQYRNRISGYTGQAEMPVHEFLEKC